MKYKSPFKRVKCTDEGAKKIAVIQDCFDDLYRSLHRQVGLHKTPQLKKAIESMETACMQYTRACALQHDEDNPFEPPVRHKKS